MLREMAEGKNNAAIAEALFLTERSVEKVIHSIFLKLGLTWEEMVHKRVKAVILYLAEAPGVITRAGRAEDVKTPAGLDRIASCPPSASARSRSRSSSASEEAKVAVERRVVLDDLDDLEAERTSSSRTVTPVPADDARMPRDSRSKPCRDSGG